MTQSFAKIRTPALEIIGLWMPLKQKEHQFFAGEQNLGRGQTQMDADPPVFIREIRVIRVPSGLGRLRRSFASVLAKSQQHRVNGPPGV